MEIIRIPVNGTNEVITTNLTRQDLIDKFISDQDVKPQSKDLYRRTLRLFFEWVDETGLDLKGATRSDIINYKQKLIDCKLSELTVGSYLVTVRKFYEWAESMKLYQNIAKGIKTPKKSKGFKKDPLTLDQTKLLLSSVDTSTVQGKRDFAILNLLLRTGLRTIELTRADVGDLDIKSGENILRIHGKGRDGKDNFVLLTDKAINPILEYLKARGSHSKEEPLFLSLSKNYKSIIARRSITKSLDDAKRLTTRTISFIAKENLKGVGLNSKKLTAHSFRHTAGVNVLRAGGDLYSTQLFMRHASPDTTQIYTATLEEELRMKNAPEKLIENLF